jgi:hypothetical protein
MAGPPQKPLARLRLHRGVYRRLFSRRLRARDLSRPTTINSSYQPKTSISSRASSSSPHFS